MMNSQFLEAIYPLIFLFDREDRDLQHYFTTRDDGEWELKPGPSRTVEMSSFFFLP